MKAEMGLFAGFCFSISAHGHKSGGEFVALSLQRMKTFFQAIGE